MNRSPSSRRDRPRRRQRVLLAAVCALAAAAAAAAVVGGAWAQSAALPPQLHTFAGGGGCVGALTSGGACDGVSATSVPIDQARGVAALPGGGFLYVDEGDDLIREVSASGTVTTLAGNGSATDAADGALATQSGLDDPVAVAVLPSGGFLITEFAGSAVRLVSSTNPATATITTIAGTGTSIALNHPSDAEPTSAGGVVVANTFGNDVLLLSSASPSATVTAVAGSPGGCSTDCDGLAADSVSLDHPVSVAPVQGGTNGYLIAEYDGDTVDSVSAQGLFSTVAGTLGQSGFGGDGGPATAGLLDHPEGVAALPAGGFLIADTDNERIREVSSNGTIATVAGDGAASYAGDGGAATAGSLMEPAAVAPTPDGGFLIADTDDDRIRAVTIPPTTTITLTPATPNGNNGWYDTPVHVTVSATLAVDTRCTADPDSAPTVYQEIPNSCPYSGPGADIGASGSHTVYAASADAAGDAELPVSTGTLKVDAVPPQVTCEATPSFLIGASASVTASVADQVSGPATASVFSVADTSRLGDHTVTVTGANNAGDSASVQCAYKVYALTLDPTPQLQWTFAQESGSGNGDTVQKLLLTRVPPQVKITVSCKGAGCRRSSIRCSARLCPRVGKTELSLAPLVSGAELEPGAKLTVVVSKARTIGRVWVLTFDRGQAPAHRVTCLAPGSRKLGKGC